MRMTTLRFSGMRAPCTAGALGRVTIIAGANGSGKTTHVEAIGAAINGDDPPRVGTGNAAVALAFDNGVGIEQRWGEKRTAFVQLQLGIGPDGAKAVQQWLAANVGPFRVGGSALLDLTPGKCQAALLGLVSEVPEGVPTVATAIREAIGPDAVAALARPANEKTKPAPVPVEWHAATPEQKAAWLGTACTALASQVTMRQSEVKTIERSLSDLATTADVAVVGTYQDVRDAQARAQATLSEAEGAVKALDALGGTARDVHGRLLANQAKRTEAETRGRALPKPATIAAPFDALLADVRGRAPDVQAAMAQWTEASAALRAAEVRRDVVAANLQRVELDIKGDGLMLVSFGTGHALCAECEQPIDPDSPRVHRVRERIADAQRTAAELRTQLTAATEGVAIAGAQLDAAQRTLADAQQLAKDVADEVRVIEADRDAKVREAETAIEAARRDYRELDRQIAADEAMMANLPTDLDPEIAHARVEGARAELATATRAMQAHEANANRQELAAKMRHRKVVAESEIGNLKAAVVTLEIWRAQLVDGAVARVMGAANEIAQRVWPSTTFGATNDGDGTMIWAEYEGARRPMTAWPHSVRCTFALAAQIGVANAERRPWRVVCLDEAQALDPRAFVAMTDALLRACDDGLLDNAILLGALTDEHLDGIDPDAVQVWQLGAQPSALKVAA